MERSGSQKILLVLSIINIIAAVVALLGGLLLDSLVLRTGRIPRSKAKRLIEHLHAGRNAAPAGPDRHGEDHPRAGRQGDVRRQHRAHGIGVPAARKKR